MKSGYHHHPKDAWGLGLDDSDLERIRMSAPDIYSGEVKSLAGQRKEVEKLIKNGMKLKHASGGFCMYVKDSRTL